LMNMKGHNGVCPCQACNIVGIRIEGSNNKIHYVPLHRDELGASYQPLGLPLRNHTQFMTNARDVEEASSDAESRQLAEQHGIKGIPILATLGSIQFPASFPYDFMHLVWENVVKTLILLWTGKFAPLKQDSGQPYHIQKTVWDAIGKATEEAGSTIPSVFGCRVPNIAERRSEFSAEAYSIWTTFLGPVLLRKQFDNEAYYRHFCKLVRLLNICLRYELTVKDMSDLRKGFADWVLEYERYVHAFFSISVLKHKYEHQHNRPSKFVQETCYGQIKRIISFIICPSPLFQQISKPIHLTLTAIAPCKITRRDRLGTPHFRTVGPYAIVDVSYIEALIGRVKDPKKSTWAIIER
ncbi:hypothetical protein BOTBODRAFT_82830, partial [Botryobasidium botryosum FD-172 SS1]